VGYHYRFVAAFAEAKRLLDQNLIGELHHLRAQAYGPVVLRPKGSTWRSQKAEGGGCLYDYSCHAIDLLNYLVGRPVSVSGSVMNGVFSSDVDDEIYSTLQFSKGFYGQLATNWSDESYRKMSVKIDIWGANGRISVDRQEVQVFLRSVPRGLEGYVPGWNVRYTTDLTQPVWFYVRGEEYSAQIDHFVNCIRSATPAISNFRTASDASLVAAMVREDATRPRTAVTRAAVTAHAAKALEPERGRSFMRMLLDRL
jgi:predicted dehydrogenase